jgi:tetratricopeptide (TPR) repeat protein
MAASRLADLLTGQDRLDEAVDLLQVHAEDGPAAGTLVALLARQGDVEALRARADAGDRLAASWLVELLARRGDVDALRTCAEEGDRLAAGLRLDLHGDREHLDALKARAETGDQLAKRHLAALLTEQPRSRTDPPIAWLATDEVVTTANEECELDDGSIEVLSEHQVCRFTDLLITGGHIDDAVAFLEACSAAAVASADDYLADLLADHGRIDQLRARAATGEWSSNRRLADLLAAQGRYDELRSCVQDGNSFAAWALADLLVEHGNVDDAIALLTTLADTGDELAAIHLNGLLADQGLTDELEARAADDQYSAGSWIDHLVRRDRIDDAVGFLRERVDNDDGLAASQLAGLLSDRGQADEAIEVLRPYTYGYGDGAAVYTLVQLLAKLDRAKDLRIEVDAGASGAADEWVNILLRRGEINDADARHLRNFGVNADGTPFRPTSG